MAHVLVGAGQLPSAESWRGRRGHVDAQPDDTIVADVERASCSHQRAIWRSRNAVQVGALQSVDGCPARAPEFGGIWETAGASASSTGSGSRTSATWHAWHYRDRALPYLRR